jgi:hypothetical protein
MISSTKTDIETIQNTQTGKEIVSIVALLTGKWVGEICRQVRFSYGDELHLDCGEMSPEDHPQLKKLLKGSWRFGARATPWLLKKADHLLLDSEQPESDMEILAAKTLTQISLESKKIWKIEVNPENLELQLFFEDDYKLILQPDLNDLDLTYWELFMPDKKILEIGPSYFWSCKSTYDRS